MDDTALFESEPTTTATNGVVKTKFLLKREFQDAVLEQANDVAKRVAAHDHVAQVLLMGSVVTKELGKYVEDKYRSAYSDIDLFVLLNCKLADADIKGVGLVKRQVTISGRKEYRWSVSDGNGNPLKLLERFSVDLWFITPGTYGPTMKRVPNLLDGAIRIK